MRRCISCRSVINRENLLKITKEHNSGISINKGFGRSAYVCKTDKCLKDTKLKKNLQKALKLSIEQTTYETIALEIENFK